MAYEIKINKAAATRIGEVDFTNIVFGQQFSDHMLVAKCSNGKWGPAEIKAYGNLSLSPATTALHYGQSIFEGLKAFKSPDGEALLFRIQDNCARLARSAKRMCMPQVPEDLFVDGIKALVDIDRAWIPESTEGSLYIRPFLFAADDFVGIRPSSNYYFVVFSCPVGPYYSTPIKIRIEQKFTRASPGGTGNVKCAGNYGLSLYPSMLAAEDGYKQILWTDAIEHKYLEECGTMNIFCVIDGVVLTPDLDGTILEGITRDSCLQLLRDEGFAVEERQISVDELMQAQNDGKLDEVFGVGTAATIAHVSSLGFNGHEYKLKPIEDRKVANFLRPKLNAIRRGLEPDPYGWVIPL